MKHWVFDLDGTLVDSFSHYFVLLKEIFEKHGVRFTDDLRISALTEPLPEFFKQHLGASAVTPAMDWLQDRSNDDARRIQPFEGVPALLAELRKCGSRIAVWTNRDFVSAGLILKHSGLEPLTDEFVSGTCVERRKPHPEGLLRICDRFGCAPSEITMVGDHEHDVTAARSIGARAFRASWHGYWDVDACLSSDRQFYRVGELAESVGS